MDNLNLRNCTLGAPERTHRFGPLVLGRHYWTKGGKFRRWLDVELAATEDVASDSKGTI